MSNTNEQIAKQLKKFMNKKGVTKDELAISSGVSIDDIGAALSKKGLSVENAVKITDALSMAFTDIIGRRSNKPKPTPNEKIIIERLGKNLEQTNQIQADIATKCSLSKSIVSQAVTYGYLTMDTAKTLSKHLNISLDYLFGNDAIDTDKKEYAQNYMFDILDEHIAIDNSNSGSPKLRISEPLDTYFKAKWLVEQEKDYDENEKENLIQKKRDTFWKEIHTDTPINYLSDKNQHVLYESF